MVSILPEVQKLHRRRRKRTLRKVPRVIEIPKRGGFLIPLISGLAALGGLIGGASNVVKVVNEVKTARKQLAEAERHNKFLEAVAVGKKGEGLYVKRYKQGYGLFIERGRKKKPQKLKSRARF